MLEGSNIIIIDTECEFSADQCRHCGQYANTFDDPPGCVHSDGHVARGWKRKLDLGLSIGCIYDYATQQWSWFDKHTLEETIKVCVKRQPLLVSFNGIVHDFALMRAIVRYTPESPPNLQDRERKHTLCDQFKALCTTSYDLLQAIWRVDPERKFERGLNSLDAISQANGLGAKSMTGTEAPRLWAQGHYAEVLNYCAGDVLKTKGLFERVVTGQAILRGDGLPITLPMPPLLT